MRRDLVHIFKRQVKMRRHCHANYPSWWSACEEEFSTVMNENGEVNVSHLDQYSLEENVVL